MKAASWMKSALAILTALITLPSAAQNRPSAARLTQAAAQRAPETKLLECGLYHYPAKLRWTGLGSDALVSFEQTEAHAVCGNAIRAQDQIATLELKSVESYDNGKMNVSALFNPGMRIILRKGTEYDFICNFSQERATIEDLQASGYALLKFRSSAADAKCGHGRYHQISKLLEDKIRFKGPLRNAGSESFAQVGYMECGKNYFKASLNPASASHDAVVKFENENAEAVCGGIYDDTKLKAQRGALGTTFAKFLVNDLKNGPLSFLDDKTYHRGQHIDKLACLNNLGTATVADVDPGYGLVSFKYSNSQLDALCGQGRYYFASWAISNYAIGVAKMSNDTRALEERQSSSHVNFLE